MDAPAKKEKTTAIPTKYIVGGLIVLGIIIGLIFYYRGKKQTTIAPLPKDDPATGNQSNAVGNANLSMIATNMYNDMNGVNWAGNHDESVYYAALSLSDTDFTQLYNIFNTKYQKGPDTTLTGWINSQSAVWYSPWETTKAAMIQRLGKLNLK